MALAAPERERYMEHRPDEIIRLTDLPKYTGLRRTQIQYYIDQGDFPRPIKLGERAKGWLASEIQAWQQARISARDTKGAL